VKAHGVVLCGGKGSRLRPLTYYFQKAMMPIGRLQKPILEYVLRLLKYHGIESATLLVGYKAEQIINYFGDGSSLGMDINYSKDHPDYPGTGGALLYSYLAGLLPDSTLLVYYADILSDIDLREMLRFHWEREAIATLAVAPSYRVPVGVVKLEGDSIVEVEEKPCIDIKVGIGIMVLEEEAVELLGELHIPGRELDIMTHLFPEMVRRGMSVKAYLTKAFWYDVGSIEKYEKLDPRILEERLDKMLGIAQR